VSFTIKTKEEEAPVLKKTTALQYESSGEEDDDDDDDDDGKNAVKFAVLFSVAPLFDACIVMVLVVISCLECDEL